MIITTANLYPLPPPSPSLQPKLFGQMEWVIAFISVHGDKRRPGFDVFSERSEDSHELEIGGVVSEVIV